MAEEAAEREDNDAPENAAASKPARRMDVLIVVIVGILVIILTPLFTFMAVRRAAPDPEPEKKIVTPAGHEFILDLAPVNVNIHGTKGTRFIRLHVTLVLSEQRLVEKLSGIPALLTDRIILAASRRTIDELEGPKGREALKRDIISEINAAIKGKMAGAVVDVYFREYLIQ